MISTPLAGTITILLLVAFGIFIYPALLRRRGGALIVTLLTIALAALYTWFDGATGTARRTSVFLGLIWALLPLITGLVVWSLQRKKA